MGSNLEVGDGARRAPALRQRAVEAADGRSAPQLWEPRMDRASGVTGGANQLLDALPADEYERLLPLLSPEFLETRTVLFEAGAPIEHVDFPRNCVISLLAPLHNGSVE